MNSHAQIQVTFHWIYVLIAGAVILLFFFSLIFSQKQRSEETLRQDLVRMVESIFTAASLSEKTKTTVDTNLDQYALTFFCHEGVSEYGLKGGSGSVQDSVHPLFSPAEVQATQLSLWSLPYKLPFKIIDFLFVTSPDIKYVVVGSTPFAEEFLEETRPDMATRFRINTLAVSPSQLQAVDPGQNRQVRFIDFVGGNGGVIQEQALVPEKVRLLDDEVVTAVVFSGKDQVEYYQKKNERWQRRGKASIISLGGERDAARYAAIFAQNAELYECNMQKAFQRLQYLNEIYGGKEITTAIAGGKLQEILAYYEAHPSPSLRQSCKPYLTALQQALQAHQNTAGACLETPASCLDLLSSARQIRQDNEQLSFNNCLQLY
ncbi:MAG: hypothetical protein AABX13_01230 [Nanoarchaeota archaeon]